MASIIATHLTSNGVTSASSGTTASISPTAGSLVIVAVASRIGSGTPNTPSVSGASTTWTQIASNLSSTDSNHNRLTFFRGIVSSGSGALSITFSSQTQDTIMWSISQFVGTDTSGSNGANSIVQNASNNIGGGGSSTGLTITLSSFQDAHNATFGVVFEDGNNAITKGASFTELNSTTILSSHIIESQFASTNQTSVPWTWSSNANPFNAMAVEIKALLGGGILQFFT